MTVKASDYRASYRSPSCWLGDHCCCRADIACECPCDHTTRALAERAGRRTT